MLSTWSWKVCLFEFVAPNITCYQIVIKIDMYIIYIIYMILLSYGWCGTIDHQPNHNPTFANQNFNVRKNKGWGFCQRSCHTSPDVALGGIERFKVRWFKKKLLLYCTIVTRQMYLRNEILSRSVFVSWDGWCTYRQLLWKDDSTRVKTQTKSTLHRIQFHVSNII